MNAILIDDEIRIREGLKILLQPFSFVNVIAEAGSVSEGKEVIERLKPDLVFLDIQLRKSTGFTMLDSLVYKDFKLVFITAYNEYALKAFKYNAFDYLLKPIDPDELKETLDRLAVEGITFKEQHPVLTANTELNKLVIKTTERIHVLQTTDIIRCEADQGYTIFYLKDKSRIVSSKTLKEYHGLLPDEFFIRIHQSHLVNMSYIKSYDREGFVALKNDEKIPVSIRKRQEISKRITGS